MEEMTLADYVAIFRRWKKVFLITSLAIFTVSLFVTMTWSNYRSTAIIQIEQPEISNNALAPAGSDRNDTAQIQAAQRISEIQQKVLAPASLVEIITKFDLYGGARKQQQIGSIADAMARKIKVDIVNGQFNTGNDKELTAIAFKISFDYNNPLLAQQVTDELATRFMDEDLKEKRTETHETVTFLDTQIAALEASLADQEKKIADFQKKSGVSRPESLAFNQQAAASATMSLQNLDAQITTNEGNIGSLRAQLAGVDPYSRVIADGQVMTTPTIQLKSLQAQYASLSAQYGPEYPDLVKVRHQIEALQPQVGHMSGATAQLKAQITDVRTNLKAATKTYGPDHPDVIALKNQLQKLEDQLASQKMSPTALGNGLVADADNPVYLQIAVQLQTAEEQHKSLLTQRSQLQAQQENYQKAITQNPEAEKELASLSRDYDNAQLRYRELKEKRMAADMDEQMQQDRKGQRLTLINPPQLPSGTSPSRKILLLASLIVSFMGGLASVLVAQTLRQSIIGPSLLETIAGTHPLACIPHIQTNEERARAQKWKSNFIFTEIARHFGRS